MILGGMPGEADSASESTVPDSDFVFGVGLFEETIANESVSPIAPALEGVGTKIWNTIKAMITAIGNFFKGLFKKTSEVSKQIDTNQKAASSENIVKRTKVIIDENGNEITEEELKKRTEEIKRKAAADEAEYQKKKASAEAHQQDEAKKAERQRKFDEEMAQMDKEREERRQQREKKERERAYREQKSREEQENRKKEQRHDAIRAQIKDKIDKISYQITTKASTFVGEIAGCAGVLDKYGLETAKTISELINEARKLSKPGDTKSDIVHNFRDANFTASGGDKGRYVSPLINKALRIGDVEKTCDRAINNLRSLKDALVNIYNSTVESLSNGDYVKHFGSEDALRKAVKANCMQQFYRSKKYLTQLKSVCETVSKSCESNIDFCKQINLALSTFGMDSYDQALQNDTKAIFDICKSYMNISKMYTMVSAYVNQIINGSIFN